MPRLRKLAKSLRRSRTRRAQTRRRSMNDRYNLPADTATLINDHIARCKNLALILDKYPPQFVVADTKNKGPWLQGLVKGGHIDATLTQSAYTRWYTMMSAINAT